MQFSLSTVFQELLHGSLSVFTLCPEHDSYHGKTGWMQDFYETKLPHSASWWTRACSWYTPEGLQAQCSAIFAISQWSLPLHTVLMLFRRLQNHIQLSQVSGCSPLLGNRKWISCHHSKG